MSHHLFRDAAIVGVYNTKQARRLEGQSTGSLIRDAILGALNDAGMSTSDLDGILVCPPYMDRTTDAESRRWGYELGLRDYWVGSSVTPFLGVIEAAAAIAMGQCTTVVVATGQAGLHSDHQSTAPWTQIGEWTLPWGLFSVAEFALVARRHMHLYNTSVEQMAAVAAAIRSHGNLHPEAVMFGRGAVSVDDVLSSRLIAEPFRLLDCAITSEGGAAIVVTNFSRAQDCRRPPTYILGAGSDTRGPAYNLPPTWEMCGDLGSRASKNAFSMAGLSPRDVRACEFYDPFSFEVIRQFEAFGFCKEGEGGDFVTSGVIERGQKYPVSTDGGLLSFSHAGQAQTAQRIIESVRQVRGDAVLQIDNCDVALASLGGSATMFSAVLLIGQGRP